jgi:hypothetical protein
MVDLSSLWCHPAFCRPGLGPFPGFRTSQQASHSQPTLQKSPVRPSSSVPRSTSFCCVPVRSTGMILTLPQPPKVSPHPTQTPTCLDHPQNPCPKMGVCAGSRNMHTHPYNKNIILSTCAPQPQSAQCNSLLFRAGEVHPHNLHHCAPPTYTLNPLTALHSPHIPNVHNRPSQHRPVRPRSLVPEATPSLP